MLTFGKEIKFGKYYITFAAMFFAFIIMIGILGIVFNANTQGLAFIAVFGPVLLSNFAFVKDNKRNPNKQEKRNLAYGFTLIIIIINLLVFYVVALLDPEFLSKMSLNIVIFAIITATFITYFLIILSFWLSARVLKKYIISQNLP